MPVWAEITEWFPDADVVSEVAEVVDFHAVRDDGLVEGAPVDARVGPNLDVVADLGASHLRNLDLPLAVEDETEPVGADDDAGVEDDAIADRRPRIKHHSRIQDAVGADGRAGADVTSGEDHSARADGRAGLDDRPGPDRDVRSESDVGRHDGRLVHAGGGQSRRQQPLCGPGERYAGPGHDDDGAIGRIDVRDEHARCCGRGYLAQVLPLRVGERPALRPLQAAHGSDFERAVAMDATIHEVRDFLHRFHRFSREVPPPDDGLPFNCRRGSIPSRPARP